MYKRQADDGVRHRIGRGEIGLDVEERRAVKAVEPDHGQVGPFDAEEPHHAHGDGIGAGRGAQREGAAANAVMAWHLQHDVPTGPVHPIEQDQVGATRHVDERLLPARIERDGADRLGFPGVLGAVLAFFPGRADTPDEIDPGIVVAGQFDGDLALPDAEGIVVL